MKDCLITFRSITHAQRGLAVRAGLHCAPLAHASAGTLDMGTVRVSFGPESSDAETDAFVCALSEIKKTDRS